MPVTKKQEDSFWEIVKICLTTIYNLGESDAETAINKKRAKLTKQNRDIFYHDEPLDVAHRMACKKEPTGKDLNNMRQKYNEILKNYKTQSNQEKKIEVVKQRNATEENQYKLSRFKSYTNTLREIVLHNSPLSVNIYFYNLQFSFTQLKTENSNLSYPVRDETSFSSREVAMNLIKG